MAGPPCSRMATFMVRRSLARCRLSGIERVSAGEKDGFSDAGALARAIAGIVHCEPRWRTRGPKESAMKTSAQQLRSTGSYLVTILVATLAVGLAGELRYPTFAAQAGRIDSIAPSCASVGDRATITGIGFGAANVTITVDGVPASVVTATGNRATFIVPAGVALGAATVRARNPGGHAGSIAFKVCDLLLPDPWAGEWQMTITSRNAATGSVTSTRNVTAFLRSGEPFGMAVIVAKLASCTGTVTDTDLDVLCTAQGTAGTCTASGGVQVTLTRTGEAISGVGASTLTATGDCGRLTSSAETIEISGQRLSLDQGAASATTTLLLSFVPHASLLSRVQ